MEYTSLNESVKNYLKIAIDIYKTIEKEEIVQIYLPSNGYHLEFSQNDKIIYSLFAAGSIVEGDFLELLKKYNVSVKGIFSFIHSDIKSIKKQSEDQYEKIYNLLFKEKLDLILEKVLEEKTPDLISPDEIIYYLVINNDLKSHVLDCYAFDYGLEKRYSSGLKTHELFKELSKKIDKDSEEKSEDSEPESAKKNAEYEKYEEYMCFDDVETIQEYVMPKLEDIKDKFVGQEECAEELFCNIVLNQQLSLTEEANGRSIIFIDGPTGTGKTAITKEITRTLNLPCVSTSITNYSASGYVGGDLTDLLYQLFDLAEGNPFFAERGIIILDEFDKISYKSNDLEMKKAVQHQLLDLMGGGKYILSSSDRKGFPFEDYEFDTSKLTFICIGALTNLRDKKTESVKHIGFGAKEQIEKEEYDINSEDLINMGLERELVGRLNTFIHTKEYSEEDLKNILLNSRISPLIGFENFLNYIGVDLIIEEDVYDLIAHEAYEMKTGARALQTIIYSIRKEFIRDIYQNGLLEIYLDCETVRKVINSMTKRKKR